MARVRLEPLHDGRTRLHWRVQVQLGGRLAQFGSRLVEATARELAGEFFERLGQALQAADARGAATAPLSWWRRLLRRFLPRAGP
jgi:hypothetical protein